MTKHRIQVAIVDDDDSVRKALSRLLRSAGMDPQTFDGGEGFLASLHERRPDCLLVDACMPGMDGAELLQRLNDVGLDVPAIVITAHDDERLRDSFRALGVAAFLLKPLDDEVLLRAIRSAKREQPSH
jgi:FixJ family two-component response regulator